MTQAQTPMGHDEAGFQAIEIVRIVTALLILVHGTYRMLSGGVDGFGMWLETQGFPGGYYWALAVTVVEWIGPVLILFRRWVSIAALAHIAILSLGAVLVHLPEGWFVVGAGRNGVEYSVLLITCLCALAWAYRPGRTDLRGSSSQQHDQAGA